jgi:cation diffusion facilitator CzcD-associated flavoprotein CzcO
MENDTHHRPADLVAAEPTSSYEVAVVGAGQAGLAIAHFLRRQGRRVLILERAGPGTR